MQHEVPEEPYKWYLDIRDQKEMRMTDGHGEISGVGFAAW